MRHTFTPNENAKLAEAVKKWGENAWTAVAAEVSGRTVRQCRERWYHYLAPNRIARPWSPEELALLRQKQLELGNHWKEISRSLPGRTENDVKNQWHTNVCPRRAAGQTQTHDRAIAEPILEFRRWNAAEVEDFSNGDFDEL
jgi:hypothetical protein